MSLSIANRSFISEQKLFPRSVICNIIRQAILRPAGWMVAEAARLHTEVTAI
jgi:hypothetical protein